LKFSEVADAEVDSPSQSAQPGSCQVDHGIRAIQR
jgi:hypothetical protein